MPRQYIDSRTGWIRYRTKLLTTDRASRFAKCLAANSSRFIEVRTVPCPTARGERRYFVTYQPVSPDSICRQAEREITSRQARADVEGAGYLWQLDTDEPRPFYRCCSLSGECYEVTDCSCTCPDWEYRLSRAIWSGLYCKHIRAYLAACDRGELTRLHQLPRYGGAPRPPVGTVTHTPVPYDPQDWPD